MAVGTLLIDTATEYLAPKTIFPGPEATASRISWAEPSTLASLLSMKTTPPPRICFPAPILDDTLPSGPHYELRIPCSEIEKSSSGIAATPTTEPAAGGRPATAQVTEQVQRTQSPDLPTINPILGNGFDEQTQRILWAVVAAIGIIIVNAILVVLWKNWRRRQQGTADAVDDSEGQVREEEHSQPGTFPKDGTRRIPMAAPPKEMANEPQRNQNGFERLGLPIEAHAGMGGWNHDLQTNWSTHPPPPPPPSGLIKVSRSLQPGQDQANTELRSPVHQRSSIESHGSRTSPLQPTPLLMGRELIPPSPSEASWRDMEICSMSPVSPLSEEDSLVSRLDAMKTQHQGQLACRDIL